MTKHWPTSSPNYAWPDSWQDSTRLAAATIALTALFHTAYALGLAVGAAYRVAWRIFDAIRAGERLNLALLRRCVADDERPSVLVIRTDGLGDALLFEPALETLAQALSPAEMHLWAPRPTCQLLRNCPSVHRLTVVPRGFKEGNISFFWSPLWRARLGFRLGFHLFEKVIYPTDSPEPLGNWLAASARSRERWLNHGTTENQFDWQQENAHRTATLLLETRPGHGHALQRNAYLANQWGGTLRLRRPNVHLDPKSLHASHAQMHEWQIAARRAGAESIITLLPAGSMPLNRYPANSWAQVVQALWERYRVICALVGAQRDQQTLNEISTAAGETPHLRMTRSLDVLATAALIGRADAVLTIDSGLAHAAVSQSVPTVVIRLGGYPGRFFPWPAPSTSLTVFHPMSCEGCLNRCTLPQPTCITAVSPEEVIEAYERLCRAKTPLRQDPIPYYVAV